MRFEKMIPEDLPFEDKARGASSLPPSLRARWAPTNTLLGNPAALAKTWDTKGNNPCERLSEFPEKTCGYNGGMPAQVDDSGFAVGKKLGNDARQDRPAYADV